MPWAWHQAVAAARRRDEERRAALPPRPPEVAAGEVLHSWLMSYRGREYAIVELRQPADKLRNRPRSDTYDLYVDHQPCGERMGMAAVHQYLREHVIPRTMTRLQRFEADRIVEMDWRDSSCQLTP